MTLEPRPTISVVHERCADQDAELVEALRQHEPTAAERLVARYGDRAYRLAVGITGNVQDAEEIVQDVFLTVLRKIETFRGESAFGSWLYRIAANAAYQKVRGRPSRVQSSPWMTCRRSSMIKADTSHPWPTGQRAWKTTLPRLNCGWR